MMRTVHQLPYWPLLLHSLPKNLEQVIFRKQTQSDFLTIAVAIIRLLLHLHNCHACYRPPFNMPCIRKGSVSYTHLRAHETKANLVCRLLLEKKKKTKKENRKDVKT